MVLISQWCQYGAFWGFGYLRNDTKSIQICKVLGLNGQNLSVFDDFNHIGGYLVYKGVFSCKIAFRTILFSESTI